MWKHWRMERIKLNGCTDASCFYAQSTKVQLRLILKVGAAQGLADFDAAPVCYTRGVSKHSWLKLVQRLPGYDLSKLRYSGNFFQRFWPDLLHFNQAMFLTKETDSHQIWPAYLQQHGIHAADFGSIHFIAKPFMGQKLQAFGISENPYTKNLQLQNCHLMWVPTTICSFWMPNVFSIEWCYLSE